MNCEEIRKNMPQYTSGDLNSEVYTRIKSHLEVCPDCSLLLHEMESTMELIKRKKKQEPNPFLYTRIKEKLSEQELHNAPARIPAYKKALQPIMISLLLTGALFSGIRIGNTVLRTQENTVTYSQDTEYFVNDMAQEPLEVFLLSDPAQTNK